MNGIASSLPTATPLSSLSPVQWPPRPSLAQLPFAVTGIAFNWDSRLPISTTRGNGNYRPHSLSSSDVSLANRLLRPPRIRLARVDHHPDLTESESAIG